MYLNITQLKDLRKKYFLMQYDMCRYIGVSDVAYRTWELRVRRPNDAHYDVLKAIFSILDKHKDEIVDRESALYVLDREYVTDGEK